ncbi:MAG TPA: hypothetical protein VKA76_03915 [Gammaproteobacteria bacterium]|nr:hypothetical protein [Gammaproteobacteria bacterium]
MKDYATDKHALFRSQRRKGWTAGILLLKGMGVGLLVGGAAAGLLYVYEQLPSQPESHVTGHAKPAATPPPAPAKHNSSPFIRVQVPLPRSTASTSG